MKWTVDHHEINAGKSIKQKKVGVFYTKFLVASFEKIFTSTGQLKKLVEMWLLFPLIWVQKKNKFNQMDQWWTLNDHNLHCIFLFLSHHFYKLIKNIVFLLSFLSSFSLQIIIIIIIVCNEKRERKISIYGSSFTHGTMITIMMMKRVNDWNGEARKEEKKLFPSEMVYFQRQ